MRIIVHDFAGHAFQVQLSRALAERGHDVLHLYAADLVTPRGPLQRQAADAPTFAIDTVDIGERFQKYGLLQRRRQESRYGQLLARRIAAEKPDAVLSSNAPLGAQACALEATHRIDGRFVFWVQDLLSKAIASAMREKLPLARKPVAWYYERLERNILRGSDAAVVISPDFLPILKNWGIDDARSHVIGNWAPLTDMPMASKQNAWSIAHDLDRAFCFLYSGTLGFKHHPHLLVDLAREFQRDADVRILVVSEGLGAEWIRERTRELGLGNLRILPFQPFDQLPQLFATADVLISVLQDEAGEFSVPSKVLSYLCPARPILAAIPDRNLAARLIRESDSGVVVSPFDDEGFVAAARRLYSEPELRRELGANGRRYAEATFDIERIAAEFERILLPASGHTTEFIPQEHETRREGVNE